MLYTTFEKNTLNNLHRALTRTSIIRRLPNRTACITTTAVVLLTACGGGSDVDNSSAPTFVAQSQSNAKTESQTIATAQKLSAVSSKELFDWAQIKYPDLLAGDYTDFPLEYQGISFGVRSIPSKNAYLGLSSSGEVYALAPFTTNVLQSYGPLSGFRTQIEADLCAAAHPSCAPAQPQLSRYQGTWDDECSQIIWATVNRASEKDSLVFSAPDASGVVSVVQINSHYNSPDCTGPSIAELVYPTSTISPQGTKTLSNGLVVDKIIFNSNGGTVKFTGSAAALSNTFSPGTNIRRISVTYGSGVNTRTLYNKSFIDAELPIKTIFYLGGADTRLFDTAFANNLDAEGYPIELGPTSLTKR